MLVANVLPAVLPLLVKALLIFGVQRTKVLDRIVSSIYERRHLVEGKKQATELLGHSLGCL